MRSSASIPTASSRSRSISASICAPMRIAVMATAIGIARPGSMVGYVGVPHGVELPIETMFFRAIGVRGGGAPARVYIPELIDDVLDGRIDPGQVLDYETDLEGIGEAYAAMDERRATKS